MERRTHSAHAEGVRPFRETPSAGQLEEVQDRETNPHLLRLGHKRREVSNQPRQSQGNLRVAEVEDGHEGSELHGACQYLRKPIQNFFVFATTLYSLTKVSQSFEWMTKHKDTFLFLKMSISEALVLALLNL